MSRYEFGEEKYPAVTDILSKLDKTGLQQWMISCVIRKGEELIENGIKDMKSVLKIAKEEPENQKRIAIEIGSWIHEEILEKYSQPAEVQTGKKDWTGEYGKKENIEDTPQDTLLWNNGTRITTRKKRNKKNKLHTKWEDKGTREKAGEKAWGKNTRDKIQEINKWGEKVIKNLDRWSEDNIKRWIEMERPVVHEGLGYAGTPDFIAEDKEGRIILGDLKVSKSIYEINKMQVSAYAAARNGMSGIYRGWNGRCSKRFEGKYQAIYVHRIGILQADRITGEVRFEEVTDDRERLFESFRGLLDCYCHIKKKSTQPKESTVKNKKKKEVYPGG